MTNSISRNARADIVAAYGLKQGTPVTASEQAQIDAALAHRQPALVMSIGQDAENILGLTLPGSGNQPSRTFFAKDTFAFGNKPPLQWEEAPRRDRSDPQVNALAAFELNVGTPATSAEKAEIDQAIAGGNEPVTLLEGLNLGMTDLKEITLKDANGDQKTFIAKDTFQFGPKPPLDWTEVPQGAHKPH
jgi:hypothetical protein